MRRSVDQARLERWMEEIGRRARGPGAVYFTGGATALLFGWRATTVDVDLKLDPEPAGIFEAIAQIKDELEINVELASPDQFIPPVPGWRERSRQVARHGDVVFYHFDLVSQSLSKLARGQDRDFDDVRAMLGIELPALPEGVSLPRQCELALYEKLVESREPDPYARYNAMPRQLSSFLEAAEGRRRRAG